MLDYLGNNMDERISLCIKKLDNPILMLEGVLKAQFQFFDKNRHLLVAVFSNGIWENNQKIQNAVAQVMSIKKKHLSTIFTLGLNNGLFTKSINKEALIHITMGAFRLHLLKWKMSNYSYDLITSGKLLIQDILILIKSK